MAQMTRGGDFWRVRLSCQVCDTQEYQMLPSSLRQSVYFRSYFSDKEVLAQRG